MQQEDGKSGDGGPGSPINYDDDELIDMEMDDCPSDEENFNSSHWLYTNALIPPIPPAIHINSNISNISNLSSISSV